MNFFPTWPLEINAFLVFGLLVVAGLIGGELARRSRYLPRITGFIAIGFVLGPGLLGLITPEMLNLARLFVDVALGLILFHLGRLLDASHLWRERPLLAASFFEAVLSFGALFGVLYFLGITPVLAALAAAIGISSSPAVVLLVVRELNASGPLTDRAVTLVALNNILSFLAFTALLPFLHYAQEADWGTILLQPLYKLLLSLLLAWLLCRVLLWLARWLGPGAGMQFALIIGVVISGVGLAKLLNASPLLMLLALGVLSRNLDHNKVVAPVDFGHGAELFFIILFVAAGANLHVDDLMTAGVASVAFVVARFLGKGLGVLVLIPVLGARKSLLIGGTLVPMAGMAIGLTQTAAEMYPAFAATLTAIVLGAIAILETIGPVATVYALKKSGEVSPEARVDH
ncbi:MAG: hypothetical protein A2V90_06040 [Gammaproteobacteria bacterium RBG_16_57_12]|nr:MAG: hypothetical protein A2V90_06040 [Gammaproteobacteria bacterium RBG_16_57_12]